MSRVRRILSGFLLLGIFVFLPLKLRGQTAADPYAPSASTDPALLDEAWQKASAKFDPARAAILGEVDKINREGPYAIELGWPSTGEAVIHSIRSGVVVERPVESVELLGSAAKLFFAGEADGLHIQLPAQAPGPIAYAFRIRFAGDK